MPSSVAPAPVRRGPSVMVASGHPVWPLDPRPEDFDMDVVGRQLAKACRFKGACEPFYCPTPEQRILTADLRWLPAGDLKVGDELLGFDEHLQDVGRVRKRRFRHARVLAAVPIRRRVVRLEMADGSTVRCSEEHPWLISLRPSRAQRWVATKDIASAVRDGRARHMHRFVDPWAFAPSREAGWLAGIYDGEGYFSIVNRRGTQLGISQLPGLVLDHAIRTLQDLGFRGLSCSDTGEKGSGVVTVQMLGGWREILRLLGSVRPLRLLDKFLGSLRSGRFDKQMIGPEAPLRIVRSYNEGTHWCTGIETSTHTYLCEGYAAHNSVAEHLVRASWLATELGGSAAQARATFAHDWAEFVFGDTLAPLKRDPELAAAMAAFYAAEERFQQAMNARFGLAADAHHDPLVAVVDQIMLATERRDVMPPGAWWKCAAEPHHVRIVPWTIELAQLAFAQRFAELWACMPPEAR